MAGHCRVSVVIPSLDDPTLPRVAAGVLAQDDADDLEVIVAGRADRSRLPDDPRLSVVGSAQRLYPGAARNLGAARATGDRLLFLDEDCVPLPGWLAAHRRYGEDARCVVGGGVRYALGGYWTLADNVSLLHEFHADLPAGPRRFLPSLNLAVPRAVWEEVGGFDSSLRSAEDLDLTARIGRAGYPLHFEPDAAILHAPARRGPGAVLGHFLTYGANSIRVRRRHPDVFGRPLALRWPLVLLLGAPLISAATTARIFLTEPPARRHWHTAPVVFLTKIAWCVSAAWGLTRG